MACEITVLSGRDGQPIKVQLTKILEAEARQTEVATLNATKAPELLSIFNKSWLDLHRLVTHLSAELNYAKIELGKRRSQLLLEVVPGVLKEKGIASSADNREAVILLDPRYGELQERVEQLDALVELLKGKLKGFENAYTSVKKLIGDKPKIGDHNPYLSGTTEVHHGFGSPKY